jgi:integrase
MRPTASGCYVISVTNSDSERFQRPAATAGPPEIRFYDLRHSHATGALHGGVRIEMISERIGHASVAFTLEVYSHVLPGVDRDAAEQMAALVVGDLDPEDEPDAEPEQRV